LLATVETVEVFMPAANSATPFLDFKSFVAEQSAPQDLESRVDLAVRSPFVSVYETVEGEAALDDPVREAFSNLVNELHDEEFDEAFFELENFARGMYQDLLSSRYTQHEAERLVSQRFSQLAADSDNMVDAISREFAVRENERLTEGEVDFFFEHYSPPAQSEPVFENFLKGLLKKGLKVVKGVASLALKGPLGLVFNLLKKHFKSIIGKIVQRGIQKLPEPVRPAAQKLAEKLGFRTQEPAPAPASDAAAAAPEAAGSPVQPDASEDPSALQNEFDQQLAASVLVPNELELETELAHFRDVSSTALPVFANLSEAREKFIQELQNLKPGESPEPYIQDFLPAILPVLRIAMRIYGRPNLVNKVAAVLAVLIRNLIGSEQATALSRAIVDAGLKLMNLEVGDQERPALAASAVASTVEETVSRVASLPDHILDNQELLEAYTLDAFEQAAAANLPAVLSEATYKQRPELLEAGVNAAWLLLPLRGRKRYKKCSRIFKVRVTPYMAEQVESFEATPLSDYLQDQLGLPEGTEVEAEVHLYETLPGTAAVDIAQSEDETPGLGAADEATLSQLHPLTAEAASTLFGKPGLGRPLPPGTTRFNLPAGLRLYHLAIPGRRPLIVPGVAGQRRVRRLFHVNLTIDIPKDQIVVCVFISEVKAQRIATRMRQQAHAGSLTVSFSRMVSRRLQRILHGALPKRLRIVHPGIPPGQTPASTLQKLPQMVPQVFVVKLHEWLVQGFSEFAKVQAQQFLAAAEDPSDGVTLKLTIEHPAGLRELAQALVEKAPGSKVAEALTQGAQPKVRTEVLPGHKCDG
jgi:hypothetical protein